MNKQIDILNKKLKISLEDAGWTFNDSTYYAVAKFEAGDNGLNPVDCTLYIDNKPIAIIKTKINPNRQILINALEQTKKYAYKYSNYNKTSIPFIFVYTNEKIIFQDLKDINSNPKEIKKIYTPSELEKMLTSIPYGPTNVTKNIDVFFNYLKLAIILVYNNSDNIKIQDYFTKRFSDDRYYSINKKPYGIKRILQLAYFLFSEVYLINPKNDIFNINNKNLNDIKIEDYNLENYKITFLNTPAELISIPQGNRIVKNNSKITISYAGGFIRDAESYAIPVYDKFRAKNEILIGFGESLQSKIYNYTYKYITHLNSDKPAEIDCLNRETDANMLASFLMNRQTQTPLNFAIASNWGTGKSSFTNFMIKSFKNINKNFKFLNRFKNKNITAEYKKAEIIHFNAWQYNNEEQIGLALLNQIYSKLNIFKKTHSSLNTALKNPQNIFALILFILSIISIAILFCNYSLIHDFIIKFKPFSNNFIDNFIKAVSILIGSGGIIAFIINFFKKLEKVFENIKIYQYNNLYENNIHLKYKIKNEICNICKYSTDKDKRLVIFIDDLDRCSKDAIINLLDTLLIYFSESNDTVIILNIDINIIIDAIKSKCKNEDKNTALNYLEKIIQLNYNIPDISAAQYKNLLNHLLPNQKNILDTDKENSIDEIKNKPQNDTNATIIETENDINIDTGSASKTNNINIPKIEIELPQEIIDSLHNFLNKTGEILQFTPRKIKRIINILRLLNYDLNKNNIDFESDKLVSVVCLLERYPAITQAVTKALQISENKEISFKNLLQENKYSSEFKNSDIASILDILNIETTIEQSLYKYISKYIFNIK